MTGHNDYDAEDKPVCIRDSPWLTVREAAGYLRLNVKTLQNYIHRRLIPFHISITGTKRLHIDELDNWLEVKSFSVSHEKKSHKNS